MNKENIIMSVLVFVAFMCGALIGSIVFNKTVTVPNEKVTVISVMAEAQNCKKAGGEFMITDTSVLIYRNGNEPRYIVECQVTTQPFRYEIQ